MIYFIHNAALKAVKIGYSDDPAKRLRKLQTGAGARLELVGTIPGGPDLERRLHVRYAHRRLYGEWFAADEAFLTELAALPGADIAPSCTRDGIRWCCVPNPPGYCRPEWQRSAAIDREGTVFAPAAITDREEAAFLGALQDGVPLLESDGHIFLPTWWIRREFPDVADICGAIEGKVWGHFPAPQGA